MKNITLKPPDQKSWMLLLQIHVCLSIIVTVLTANLVQVFVSFSPQLCKADGGFVVTTPGGHRKVKADSEFKLAVGESCRLHLSPQILNSESEVREET